MKTNNEWLNDYEEFLGGDIKPPAELTQRVTGKIQKLLNPSSLLVFFKILGIHLSVGFMSLSICHQFGINPFDTDKSLDSLMMQFGGHQLCMFGCGILFVGLSLLAAGLFLKIEDVGALRRTEFFQSLVLGLISLGFFTALGTEIALGIAFLWLFGALIGGVAATETIWRIKRV